MRNDWQEGGLQRVFWSPWVPPLGFSSPNKRLEVYRPLSSLSANDLCSPYSMILFLFLKPGLTFHMQTQASF